MMREAGVMPGCGCLEGADIAGDTLDVTRLGIRPSGLLSDHIFALPKVNKFEMFRAQFGNFFDNWHRHLQV